MVLSQADFAMSKIAADEAHGGNMLRKAIDYFCHLAVKPEFWSTVSTADPDWMATEYAIQSAWLKDDKDDIYDPDYNDVLRVAFMYRFSRGKLADLVTLLSGRDFETRDFKGEIADESFDKLREGVLKFMDRNNFQDFTLALRSAGFVSPSMIHSKGAVNFAYNLYLRLREDKSVAATDVKRYVPALVRDERAHGALFGIVRVGDGPRHPPHLRARVSGILWRGRTGAAVRHVLEVQLPQNLVTTSTRTGAWLVFRASQVRAADNSELSRRTTAGLFAKLDDEGRIVRVGSDRIGVLAGFEWWVGAMGKTLVGLLDEGLQTSCNL